MYHHTSLKRALRAPLVAAAIAASCSMLGSSGSARAADHDDTPALKEAPRHEARITDLHVFTRSQAGAGRKKRENLVLSLSTNPTIPPDAATYAFPSDLTLAIHIDRNSKVAFDDAEASAKYGGTVMRPGKISPEITFTVTFDEAGEAALDVDGLEEGVPIQFFAGLRDDPFIRGPRQGRNVGSVVIELPLQVVAGGKNGKTLLVWATSTVPRPLEGAMGDLGARALRSQLAPEIELNDFDPSRHHSELGLVPDVVIFDTSKAANFPNGRILGDDVVDLVADPGVRSTDCPVPGDPVKCFPMSNDKAFLETFPYLAAPHPAP
jgi:hypothetical protein